MDSTDAVFLPGHEATLLSRAEAVVREANVPRLMAVAFQFALLVALAQFFHLEYRAVRLVMAMALVGFVVHHMLPMAMRLPFFVLLSVASLVVIVLPMNTMRLVGVGGVLIAICHLPIRFGWRLALIAAAAAGLSLARAEWFVLPGYEAIWPILGSMFMFRLIVYLYDLRHQSAPFSFWRSLGYFFMVPNVCFPMFPLVDYQAFNRTYFNEPTPWRMYQVGIKWIFRGLIHLLLYRLITQNFTISADAVANAGDLVRYMVTTFLLYLQISGQFHLIVGILHLFGFNLPETHHNYLLSSSFTDFWRRINIYWKDFILKVFFNPVYFRLKHWPAAAAMTVATLVAFFFTWLLHSYQWFWIRGTFPMIWQDILFWGILALLVLVNALYEQRYGRSRVMKGKRRSLGSSVALALQTAGTFSVIVTLWCLWTFQGSFSEWLIFMGNFARIDLQTALVIIAGLTGVGIAAVLMADVGREYSAAPKDRQADSADADFTFWRSAIATSALIVLLPAIVTMRNHLPTSPIVATVLGDLRHVGSAHARAERDQGYYEDLTNTKSYNQALWELYNRGPQKLAGVRIGHTPAGKMVPDKFQWLELVPSKRVESEGAAFTTNRWGMRDREYDKKKSPGVFRVALLGSSITMGWAVGDDQTYENLLEDRLNRDHAAGPYQRFDFLNFGASGYGDLQKLWAFERALEFEPDVVFWEIHATGLTMTADHLARIISTDVPIPYPELREMLEGEGLNSRASGLVLRSKLRRLAPALLAWVLQRIQRECGARGIRLQAVMLPRADQMRVDAENLAQLAEITRSVGVPILDITSAYEGVADRRTVAVVPGDAHPNPDGHRMLADKLYEVLRAAPSWAAVLGGDQPTSAVTRDEPHGSEAATIDESVTPNSSS